MYARIIIPSRPQIKELQVYFPQSWPLGKWVDSLASTQRLPGTDQLGEGKRWGLILGDQVMRTEEEGERVNSLPLNDPVSSLIEQGVLSNPMHLSMQILHLPH